MEKQRNISLKDRKIRIAGSIVLASSFIASTAQAEGKTPYVYSPTPREEFKPLVLNEVLAKKKDLTINIPSPAPLSKEEIIKQKLQKELDRVISTMSSNPDVFKDKYVEDAKMYYPIYKKVADKYNLDWYLLFIVHENETGASAGTRGFSSDSYYKGAMQIDPNVWSQDFIDNAANGLEGLKDLPQRHNDDWKNIATAAAILDRNIEQYKNLGKDKAVLNALLLYSADNEARQRYEQYQKYRKVFSETSIAYKSGPQ